jgi:hypothetical protein
MTKEPIYDTANKLILNNQGATIYANREGIVPTYSSEFETFLAATKENRPTHIEAAYDLYTELLLRELHGNLAVWYPMNGRTTDSLYKEYHSLGALVAVGADSKPEYNGLAGDGSALYYRVLNPSSIITDINNFTVGIYSQTDDDAGTDWGCSDGTNTLSISCKSGGNCVMKVGTVTITNAVATGDGHFILNVQGGALSGWYAKSKVLAQLGNVDTVAGAIPDIVSILAAYMNTATPTDYSSKRISTLWIYNGLLTDAGVGMMNQLIENYHLNTGKSVNYGA